MSEGSAKFSCPQCDRRFKWKAEFAGKRLKCPCGHRFPVPEMPRSAAASAPKPKPKPQPVAPAETEQDDWLAELGGLDQAGDAPPQLTSIEPPKKRKLKTKTGKTRSGGGGGLVSMPGLAKGGGGGNGPVGIKIAGAGMLAQFAGFVCIFIGLIGVFTAAQGIGDSGERSESLMTALKGSGILYLLGLAGVMLGPLLGLAAPADGGRTSLIFCLACIGISFGLGIGMASAEIPLFVAVVGIIILSFVGWFFFLQFYCDLSMYIEHHRLMDTTNMLKNSFFGLIGLQFLLGCSLALIPGVAQLIAWGMLIAWVIWMVGYIFMTFRLAYACFNY